MNTVTLIVPQPLLLSAPPTPLMLAASIPSPAAKTRRGSNRGVYVDTKYGWEKLRMTKDAA